MTLLTFLEKVRVRVRGSRVRVSRVRVSRVNLITR